MNIKHLTPEELIHYIESGVITNVPSEQLLSILEHMQSEIESLKEQVREEGDYDKRFYDAVDEMKNMLERL